MSLASALQILRRQQQLSERTRELYQQQYLDPLFSRPLLDRQCGAGSLPALLAELQTESQRTVATEPSAATPARFSSGVRVKSSQHSQSVEIRKPHPRRPRCRRGTGERALSQWAQAISHVAGHIALPQFLPVQFSQRPVV